MITQHIFQERIPDLEMARLHLDTLTGDVDPLIDVQVFCDSDKTRRDLARSMHGRFSKLVPQLLQAQQQGCGVFVALNQTDGSGRRKKENVIAARVVFLDLDGSPLPDSWPEAPAMVMRTSAPSDKVIKFHAWWPIQPTEDLDGWVAFQKLLADRYGGDPKCALTTQVGRLAGFFHQKNPEHPHQVTIIEHDEHYGFGTPPTLQELADTFGFDIEAAKRTAPERARIDEPAGGWDDPADIERAEAFASDSGNWHPTNDGSVSIYKMACALRDFAISPETAIDIIDRHVPVAVDLEQIELKVRNAYQYAQGDVGERSVNAAANDFADGDIVGEGHATDNDRNVSGLTYMRADEVQERPLQPLWPNRIFVGKLTTIAGMPDQGKSIVTCDIAARVTLGGEWPDGSGEAPQGSAIILAAEDDSADTIKPRLMAAGAAMDRVYIVDSLVTDGSGKGKPTRRMLSIADDLPRLTALVKRHPDVRLLIIDTINSYIGTSKEHDSFRDSDVRAVLGPLKEWAEEHQIAVVMVTHFKKGGTGRAIDQVMGSLAFTALSRSAWAIIPEELDGEATGRKLLAKIKQNVTAPVNALAFKLVGKNVSTDISAPAVEWDGDVSGAADDFIGGSTKQRGSPKQYQAQLFLLELLFDGPVLAKEVMAKARTEGHAEKTLNRAKAEVGAESFRSGKDHEWYWRLVDPDDEDD